MAKRLNHLPTGTSGVEASQSENSPRSSMVIWRSRARRIRWRSGTSGGCSRRILGMRNLAVKSPHHFVFQPLRFSRVFRGKHLFTESSQFLARELPSSQIEPREMADLLLFLRRKAFDLLDDFGGAHRLNLKEQGRVCNPDLDAGRRGRPGGWRERELGAEWICEKDGALNRDFVRSWRGMPGRGG